MSGAAKRARARRRGSRRALDRAGGRRRAPREAAAPRRCFRAGGTRRAPPRGPQHNPETAPPGGAPRAARAADARGARNPSNATPARTPSRRTPPRPPRSRVDSVGGRGELLHRIGILASSSGKLIAYPRKSPNSPTLRTSSSSAPSSTCHSPAQAARLEAVVVPAPLDGASRRARTPRRAATTPSPPRTRTLCHATTSLRAGTAAARPRSRTPSRVTRRAGPLRAFAASPSQLGRERVGHLRDAGGDVGLEREALEVRHDLRAGTRLRRGARRRRGRGGARGARPCARRR